MAKFIVRTQDQSRFENKIKVSIGSVVNRAMKKTISILKKEAEILSNEIKNADDYQEIKTNLVGQFGFTPEEVANLDRILELLVPGPGGITNITTKASPDGQFVVLNWVDFKKLKEHPYALHPLTRYNPRSGQFEVTNIVSWVEWLEEGVTINRHIFAQVEGSNRIFSRSGQGIMRELPGGMFALRPTRLFEETAKAYSFRHLKEMFKKLVRNSK